MILYTGSPLKGVGEEEDVQEDVEDAEDHNQLLQPSAILPSLLYKLPTSIQRATINIRLIKRVVQRLDNVVDAEEGP